MKTNKKENKPRAGVTLIEIMVSITLLAILAILSVSTLAYPRYLVVTSGLEQSAIHAGNSVLESHLNNFSSPTEAGLVDTDGWRVSITTSLVAHADNLSGVQAEFMEIQTTVEYRDGRTVELATYRSLEVPSSER